MKRIDSLDHLLDLPSVGEFPAQVPNKCRTGDFLETKLSSSVDCSDGMLGVKSPAMNVRANILLIDESGITYLSLCKIQRV